MDAASEKKYARVVEILGRTGSRGGVIQVGLFGLLLGSFVGMDHGGKTVGSYLPISEMVAWRDGGGSMGRKMVGSLRDIVTVVSAEWR